MADTHLEIPAPDGSVRQVKLSSADRELWPGITKHDLVDYLLAVAEPFLLANGDRPMTLQRFPEGIEGEEFFSKRPPKGAPDFLRTVMCTYPSGRRHTQLVLDEPASLAWAGQMGTITFHPWAVRTANVDNPDELRIDLDPQPGRDFRDAVEAASALRELMVELGLTPFVKTSGNRGVHVFARIRPDHEFQAVRHGVIGIARELERRLPDLVTSSWWKEERGERVFVDFNQANRDRTLAAAWSPRPLPGAPVSMPVAWEELPDVSPADFTLRTVPGLLAEGGNPWADLDAHVGDLGPALALWQADLDRGLGELNFPPDYPKMPGEPPRVPPSKRRKGRADDEYLAPKAERDAEWGTAITPPFGPMLARPVKKLPKAEALYEPKWDGFRTLVWRSGDAVEFGSRTGKPMTRYFPELVEAVREQLPENCCVDGEIIMVNGDRLDFDLLQQRLHPAASRIAKLAEQTPASLVVFDVLAIGMTDYTQVPFEQRREVLEDLLGDLTGPVQLTPTTRDRDQAMDWFEQFEGAGLDGIIAKPLDMLYEEEKRVMYKLKHERTADCVVAGYRLHKDTEDAVGSLLLGLHDDSGELRQVGVIGALPMERRRELFTELQELVVDPVDHPWPQNPKRNRWNASRDMTFTPLRPEWVVEVRYDHMEGPRFRHTAQWVRWRPDRTPESCTFAQLEEPVKYDLGRLVPCLIRGG